jgi:hypothetical protein
MWFQKQNKQPANKGLKHFIMDDLRHTDMSMLDGDTVATQVSERCRY